FFQAADGIRDFHVTGVQTCALPISGCGGSRRRSPTPPPAPAARSTTGARSPGWNAATGGSPRSATAQPTTAQPATAQTATAQTRSEERRVGEEAGERWKTGGQERGG